VSRMCLRLPASSANLGPGFDTLALSLKLYLEIEAEPAKEFTIDASGRDAAVCAAIDNNLLLDTYRSLLSAHHKPVVPVRLQMKNGIPLGMGCGSSAAVRLAAVALASHFGGLGWNRERILAEACRLEGHPDNAAACWLGGFVASAMNRDQVQAVSFAPPPEWRALIVMPREALATTASRAVLPAAWPRSDVVANLQRVALLTAAFARGEPGLLANAMRDWLHQPYRAEVCPLLKKLEPLAGHSGVAGVALSGAGPAVLLVAVSEQAAHAAIPVVSAALGSNNDAEILVSGLESVPAAAEFLG
jgi:homoserine kinase